MNLQQLLSNIDTSKKQEYVSLHDIAEEFDIYDVYEDKLNRMQSYYITRWMCTDTWVGTKAYFLDGNFICISSQPARKSDINFKWASLEIYNDTKQYILSLIEKENDFDVVELITKEHFKKDLGKGYHIDYSSQFITNEVICKITGEDVTILDCFRSNFTGKKLKIQYKNGSIKTVTTSDVLVPYCL